MKDKKTSVSAIIGFIFAILALLLSAVPIINNFAFVLAIIGVICGIIALVGVKQGKSTGKRLAIATLVIAVVASGIVLASQKMYGDAIDQASTEMNESLDRMSGDKTEEILGKEVNVEFGEFTAETSEYGFTNTNLVVKVTNKLDEKKSYYIQVEAVDADGNRIVDDYISANDLGANQSQDFEIFTYVEDAKLEAVKSATFKVVSVSQL